MNKVLESLILLVIGYHYSMCPKSHTDGPKLGTETVNNRHTRVTRKYYRHYYRN